MVFFFQVIWNEKFQKIKLVSKFILYLIGGVAKNITNTWNSSEIFFLNMIYHKILFIFL